MLQTISRLSSQYPVRLAFLGSLVLSLIAVLGVATIGRDAALYLTIVQNISEQGVAVGFASFNWPWFLFLLAGTHVLTGLSPENCAYLWEALFMAGTCALLVDCVRQRVPKAAGWACVLVLALPAANQFRDDIIREFGFWFFCVLALWLALRWQSRGGWSGVVGIHLAITAAALFRLEAVVLVPALLLWQLCQVRSPGGGKRFLQLVSLPALAAVLAAAALILVGKMTPVRVAMFLEWIDPQVVLASFNKLAQQFGDSLTVKYSRPEAGRIIFFGMMAALLIKLVTSLGPFSLPLLHKNAWRAMREYVRDFQPFIWVAALYFVILVVFFIVQQFMNSRYLSFLSLMLVPLLAVAAMAFAQRFPRLGKGLLAIALLVSLTNVISTGAKKTHYLEAAKWVEANIPPESGVYYEDGRISYYAGRGYFGYFPRDRAFAPHRIDQYQYFLVDARADDPWLQGILKAHNLRIVTSFANRKGSTVVVIGR